MIFDLLEILHYYSDIDTRLFLENIFNFKKGYKLKQNEFTLPLSPSEETFDTISCFYVNVGDWITYYKIFYQKNEDGSSEWEICCYGDTWPCCGAVVTTNYIKYELDVSNNTWHCTTEHFHRYLHDIP